MGRGFKMKRWCPQSCSSGSGDEQDAAGAPLSCSIDARPQELDEGPHMPACTSELSQLGNVASTDAHTGTWCGRHDPRRLHDVHPGSCAACSGCLVAVLGRQGHRLLSKASTQMRMQDP